MGAKVRKCIFEEEITCACLLSKGYLVIFDSQVMATPLQMTNLHKHKKEHWTTETAKNTVNAAVLHQFCY